MELYLPRLIILDKVSHWCGNKKLRIKLEVGYYDLVSELKELTADTIKILDVPTLTCANFTTNYTLADVGTVYVVSVKGDDKLLTTYDGTIYAAEDS